MPKKLNKTVFFKHGCAWSTDEELELMDLYPHFTTTDLCYYFGRTASSIVSKILDLRAEMVLPARRSRMSAELVTHGKLKHTIKDCPRCGADITNGKLN